MASKVPMRQVRMEDDVHAKIRHIARHDQRSFTAEVVYILKLYIQRYEAEHGPIPVPSSDQGTEATQDSH